MQNNNVNLESILFDNHRTKVEEPTQEVDGEATKIGSKKSPKLKDTKVFDFLNKTKSSIGDKIEERKRIESETADNFPFGDTLIEKKYQQMENALKGVGRTVGATKDVAVEGVKNVGRSIGSKISAQKEKALNVLDNKTKPFQEIYKQNATKVQRQTQAISNVGKRINEKTIQPFKQNISNKIEKSTKFYNRQKAGVQNIANRIKDSTVGRASRAYSNSRFVKPAVSAVKSVGKKIGTVAGAIGKFAKGAQRVASAITRNRNILGAVDDIFSGHHTHAHQETPEQGSLLPSGSQYNFGNLENPSVSNVAGSIEGSSAPQGSGMGLGGASSDSRGMMQILSRIYQLLSVQTNHIGKIDHNTTFISKLIADNQSILSSLNANNKARMNEGFTPSMGMSGGVPQAVQAEHAVHLDEDTKGIFSDMLETLEEIKDQIGTSNNTTLDTVSDVINNTDTPDTQKEKEKTPKSEETKKTKRDRKRKPGQKGSRIPKKPSTSTSTVSPKATTTPSVAPTEPAAPSKIAKIGKSVVTKGSSLLSKIASSELVGGALATAGALTGVTEVLGAGALVGEGIDYINEQGYKALSNKPEKDSLEEHQLEYKKFDQREKEAQEQLNKFESENKKEDKGKKDLFGDPVLEYSEDKQKEYKELKDKVEAAQKRKRVIVDHYKEKADEVGIVAKDENGEPIRSDVESDANAIEALKKRGYSEEFLQNYGNKDDKNFISVNDKKYSHSVVGLYNDVVQKEITGGPTEVKQQQKQPETASQKTEPKVEAKTEESGDKLKAIKEGNVEQLTEIIYKENMDKLPEFNRQQGFVQNNERADAELQAKAIIAERQNKLNQPASQQQPETKDTTRGSDVELIPTEKEAPLSVSGPDVSGKLEKGEDGNYSAVGPITYQGKELKPEDKGYKEAVEKLVTYSKATQKAAATAMTQSLQRQPATTPVTAKMAGTSIAAIPTTAPMVIPDIIPKQEITTNTNKEPIVPTQGSVARLPKVEPKLEQTQPQIYQTPHKENQYAYENAVLSELYKPTETKQEELVTAPLEGSQKADSYFTEDLASQLEYDTEEKAKDMNINSLDIRELNIEKLTIKSTGEGETVSPVFGPAQQQQGFFGRTIDKAKSFFGFGPEAAPGAPGQAKPETGRGGGRKPVKEFAMPADKVFGIAALEESGGDAGKISSGSGDAGGKSYGQFQLASNTGDLKNFLNKSGYAEQFQGLQAGSAQFDAKWKELAKNDPKFAEAQKQHAKRTHFDPQMEKLEKSGMDVSKLTDTQKAAVFSTANQYGAHTSIIEKAFAGKDTSNMSEEQWLNTLQDYKAQHVSENFRSSNANVQAGVAKRIERERGLLLKQSAEEKQLAAKSQPEQQLAKAEAPKEQTASLVAEQPTQEPLIQQTIKASTPIKEKPSEIAGLEKSMNNVGQAVVQTAQSNAQGMPIADTNNKPNAGFGKVNLSVRNDDPLLLTLQYGNLRTV